MNDGMTVGKHERRCTHQGERRRHESAANEITEDTTRVRTLLSEVHERRGGGRIGKVGVLEPDLLIALAGHTLTLAWDEPG